MNNNYGFQHQPRVQHGSRPGTPNATPLPKIVRDASGRFDMSSRGDDRSRTPASSRPSSPAFSSRQNESEASSLRVQEPSRSGSAAPQHNRSGSRRGSFRQFFRRGSQELGHVKDIIVAPKEDRLAWMEEEKARIKQEMKAESAKEKRPTQAERRARLEAEKAARAVERAARAAREAEAACSTKGAGLTPEYERHIDQPDFSRRPSESSSPSRPRNVDEEGYIKIPGSHKIRRVRKTVYCDPGNPFELEDFQDDEYALLSESQGRSSAFTESSGFNPELRISNLNSSSPASSSGFIFEVEGTPEHCPASSTYSETEDSVLHRRGSPDVGMERFSGKVDLPLHAPKARRPGTPALVSAHSIKEALMTAPPEKEKDVYVPPRSLWRRSLPSNNLAEATGHVHNVRKPSLSLWVRDTKFYGFYDGVLDEYRADLESQI